MKKRKGKGKRKNKKIQLSELINNKFFIVGCFAFIILCGFIFKYFCVLRPSNNYFKVNKSEIIGERKFEIVNEYIDKIDDISIQDNYKISIDSNSKAILTKIPGDFSFLENEVINLVDSYFILGTSKNNSLYILNLSYDGILNFSTEISCDKLFLTSCQNFEYENLFYDNNEYSFFYREGNSSSLYMLKINNFGDFVISSLVTNDYVESSIVDNKLYVLTNEKAIIFDINGKQENVLININQQTFARHINEDYIYTVSSVGPTDCYEEDEYDQDDNDYKKCENQNTIINFERIKIDGDKSKANSFTFGNYYNSYKFGLIGNYIYLVPTYNGAYDTIYFFNKNKLKFTKSFSLNEHDDYESIDNIYYSNGFYYVVLDDGDKISVYNNKLNYVKTLDFDGDIEFDDSIDSLFIYKDNIYEYGIVYSDSMTYMLIVSWEL